MEILPPKDIKTTYHVKGCQGYNLLRPGSGLERLAKSKGLSSPRLPSTQEEFATGIHSPFKNFQSSLWIGSLKIQYHFILRTSYACLCSHPCDGLSKSILVAWLIKCNSMPYARRFLFGLQNYDLSSSGTALEYPRDRLHSEEPSTVCRIAQASPERTGVVAASLEW